MSENNFGNIVDKTESNDECVETAAQVVLDRVADRVGKQLSTAVAPLVAQISEMRDTITQMNIRLTEAEHSIDDLGSGVDELVDDSKNADIRNNISLTQHLNILNKRMLGRTAETV